MPIDDGVGLYIVISFKKNALCVTVNYITVKVTSVQVQNPFDIDLVYWSRSL